MKNIFEVSNIEKLRILNLHETSTRRQYLLKEQEGSTKAEYPSCVQKFGDPVVFGNGTYAIRGTGDWAGYNFGFKYFYDPNTKKNDNLYFCRGDEIIFGEKKGVSSKTASLVNAEDTDISVVANGEKVITLGSSGPLVKVIQGWLQDRGDIPNPEKIGGIGCSSQDTSKCDGYFGPATKEALKEYQKFRGLSVDGIFGQEVYSVAYSSIGTPTKPAPPPPPPETPQPPIQSYEYMTSKYGKGFK